MAQPWFDPILFGAWYGSLAGGIGGSLAGIWGALAAKLAPRGKGKTIVLGGMTLLIILGVVSLLIGVIALADRQPYGIWYPLLLVGVILPLVMGNVLWKTRLQYRQAEARKLEAAIFRKQ